MHYPASIKTTGKHGGSAEFALTADLSIIGLFKIETSFSLPLGESNLTPYFHIVLVLLLTLDDDLWTNDDLFPVCIIE